MVTGGAVRRKGYALSLIATVWFGIGMVLSKFALQHLDPIVFCLLFSIVSGVYALAYVLLTHRKHMLAIPAARRWRVLAFGVITGAYAITFYTAIKLLDPTVASLFSRMDVVFTVILGVAILHDWFAPVEALGLVIVLGGIVAMNWHSPKAELAGFAWMLAASILGGAVNVVGGLCVDLVYPEGLTFYRFFLSVVIIAGYLLVTGQAHGAIHAVQTAALAAIAGTSLAYFVAILFFFHSIKHISVARSVAINQGIPVIVVFLSVAFLKSMPSILQAVGGIIVLIGVVLLVLSGNSSESERATGPGTDV